MYRPSSYAMAAAASLLFLATPAAAQFRGGSQSRTQGNFTQSSNRTISRGNSQNNRQSSRGSTRDINIAEGNPGGLDGQDPRVGPSGMGMEAERTYATDGFVGRDAANVSENFRNMTPQQRRGAAFDVMIESLNEMRESRRRWQAEQSEPPPVRVRLQPLFSYAPPAAAKTQAAIEASFNRTWQSNSQQKPTVSLNGRTATLRGTATSKRDRKLAERMASLQPGVSRVENEITVAQ